ncbi:MAG: glycosyltransferase family 4 protein [Mycobacterium leprae]
MRVAIDATPLLGVRAGIGHYVAGLVTALDSFADGPEVVLTAFTWRGADGLASWVTARRAVAHRRAPVRLLQQAWLRGPLPPVEWLCGPVDVFHGTNFVLPPTRRAAGVVTVHDLAYLDHPDTVTPATLRYRRLVPAGLRRAGAVCTPSRAVADRVVEVYGVDPGRVFVTPNGLGPRWLAGPSRPSPEWLLARGLPERYALFVGTVEPRKNVPVLLEAYRRLLARGERPPALVVAGAPGWDPAAATVDLPADTVVVTGYLTEDDLVTVTAGASCLVLPSRAEGFGLPPLQAFACGVPVVVSDLPVFREVLGPFATYVPPGDGDALAAAVAAAVRDDGGEAARRARQAYARRHTWQRCAAETLRAYRTAAGQAEIEAEVETR